MFWFSPSREFPYLYGVVDNAISLAQFRQNKQGIFVPYCIHGKPFPEEVTRKIQAAYYTKFDCSKYYYTGADENNLPRFITAWTIRDQPAILDTEIWCIYEVRIDGIELYFKEGDAQPTRSDKMCANEHAMLFGF